MFELLHHFVHMQQLAHGSNSIEFGAQDISNESDASGNQASEWNYGLFLCASCAHTLLVFCALSMRLWCAFLHVLHSSLVL